MLLIKHKAFFNPQFRVIILVGKNNRSLRVHFGDNDCCLTVTIATNKENKVIISDYGPKEHLN